MMNMSDAFVIKKAKELLAYDPVTHADMLQAIIRGNAENVHVKDTEAGFAVLLHHKICEALMIAANDASVAKSLIRESGLEILFCVTHGEPAAEAVMELFDLDYETPCLQCIYVGSVPPIVHEGFNIVKLGMSYLDFVLEHYPHGREYVKDRLSSGAVYGIEEDGKIVGFIGEHDDGSVGMLEVLPEYRRRGFASALQSYKIAEQMAKGWVAYGQVYLDNDASFSLQRSMGMELSDGRIRWMFKRREQ